MNDSLQDVLFTGEELLWSGKPHKFCFVLSRFGKLLPVALVFLLFDGFFIGMMISTGELGAIWPILVIFFALHLMPVWLCVGKLIGSCIEHKNIIYAVTTRRMIARTGIVGLDFEGIDYVDISNVRVNVSFIERLFRVGSLIVSTSSGYSLVIQSVEDPYGLYRRVNEIFVDMKADVHFPNAYRPEANPGYRTRYRK